MALFKSRIGWDSENPLSDHFWEMARAVDSPVFGTSAKVLKQSANIFLAVTSLLSITGRCDRIANKAKIFISYQVSK